MESRQNPFTGHIFVCTHDRQGSQPSCADEDSAALRSALKILVKERGLQDRVRVTQTGCLGLCSQQAGPHIVLHPQGIWYSGVTLADLDTIINTAIKKSADKNTGAIP